MREANKSNLNREVPGSVSVLNSWHPGVDFSPRVHVSFRVYLQQNNSVPVAALKCSFRRIGGRCVAGVWMMTGCCGCPGNIEG